MLLTAPPTPAPRSSKPTSPVGNGFAGDPLARRWLLSGVSADPRISAPAIGGELNLDSGPDGARLVLVLGANAGSDGVGGVIVGSVARSAQDRLEFEVTSANGIDPQVVRLEVIVNGVYGRGRHTASFTIRLELRSPGRRRSQLLTIEANGTHAD